MVYSSKILNNLINLCKTHPPKTKQRHAAGIYRNNKHFLGSGLNMVNRTSAYGCTDLPSIHAEASAIHNAFGGLFTSGVLRDWLTHGVLSPKVT